MATIKRIVTIGVALVLVILGGAVLYLSLADLSRFRPRLEALASDVLGRELRIGGDFDLEVLPRPALVATDVTFANASWGASEPMLSAGRLAVEVGLWSLVSGPIRIRKLELHDVAVLLERNAAGEANWTMPRATPPQEATDSEGLPVVVEVASLDNFEVLLRLPDRDELRVAVTALELRTDPRGVGTVDASGSAADTPFTIKGTFAPGGGSRARVELDATIADTALRAGADLRPRQVDFTVSTADLSRVAALLAVTQELPAAPLELAGTLLFATDHYELRDATAKLLTAESRIAATIPRSSGEPIAIEVSLTAPDVSELRAGLPPLRLASSVKGAISAERIDVDPLTIELGDSDFSGAGSVVLGDVIAIAIKGQSKLIELTPFEPAPPQADDASAAASNASASRSLDDSPTAEAPSEWMFVEEELPFERLRSLDVSAELAADEVRSRDAHAQNFKLALNGKGGTYDVRTSFDVAEGGAAEGHFVFDAAGDTAEVALEFAANGLLLNIASGAVDDPSQIPPLGLSATVRSTGDSPRALASVANGRLILTQGPGRIDNSAVGLASGDILAQIFGALNPFAKDEPYSKWDCTVVALGLTDGIGELEPMLAQAEKLLIVGHGTVDLKTEKLDIEFNTKPRTGVGVTADMFVTPFVKLSGTLTNPGVGMNASGTLLAGGAAALTGGMSLVVRGLADRATAEADQCAKAFAEIQAP